MRRAACVATVLAAVFCLPAAAQDQPGSRAVLTGSVRDSSGAPVADARVTVRGAAATTVTDSGGRFTLHDLPAGAAVVVVQKIGLPLTERPITLSATASNELHVTVRGSSVPVLPEVVVRARWQAALGDLGFYDRRQRRLGGLYIDIDEMDRMVNRASLAAILARADNLNYVNGRLVGRFRSGVQVDPDSRGGGRNQVALTGGYTCVAYIVDGSPWVVQNPAGTRIFTTGHGREPMRDPADLLPVRDVAAVEVYRPEQVSRELPFYSYVRGCETVVIWTRAYLAARR